MNPIVTSSGNTNTLPVDSSSARQLVEKTPSRRSFLRRSLVGAGIAAPVALFAACGSSSDAMADQNTTALTPTTQSTQHNLTTSKQIFTGIMDDENAHVSFLQEALKQAGVPVRPKPTFKGLEQGDLESFAQLSQTFENVGVGAYLLAAPAIKTKDYLAAAGSILTVEARHAGALGVLLNKPISPSGAFDKPLSQDEIVKAVGPFVADLNGGSDPAAPLANDADILGFALLLEYLEAEYYNVNVPRLFNFK